MSIRAAGCRRLQPACINILVVAALLETKSSKGNRKRVCRLVKIETGRRLLILGGWRAARHRLLSARTSGLPAELGPKGGTGAGAGVIEEMSLSSRRAAHVLAWIKAREQPETNWAISS